MKEKGYLCTYNNQLGILRKVGRNTDSFVEAYPLYKTVDGVNKIRTMAKKKKEIIYLIEGVAPGLFGQKYSSRDYRYEDSWGKNQFNSSFPASLVAYMGSKGVKPVFICTNKNNEIVHKYIDSKNLLGVDPLSEDAYYDFEAGYYPYEQYYSATKKEKIDLVMINRTRLLPSAASLPTHS